MPSAGFLNLPEWHELLPKIFAELNHSEMLRLPVLGSENVDRPWVALDREEFFSVVQTGIHFSGKSPCNKFPEIVVTTDAVTAIQRLLQGNYHNTFFSAAIGATYAFQRITNSEFSSAMPEKILVQNDSVTSFILTKMENEGKNLQEATHESQWDGVVNGNPNFHLHGIVTRDRLVLQIAELFGLIIKPESINTLGISVLENEDVVIASQLGFSIRLLGLAEYLDGKLKAVVEPCMIPSAYLLAQARGGSEMVYLKTADEVSQVYSCHGTSFKTQVRAVLHDLFAASARKFNKLEVVDKVEDFIDCYYLRFSLVNMNDTMAQILHLFNQTDIEIETIHQPVPFVSRETQDGGRHCVVLITGKTKRENVEKALELLKCQIKLATVKACFRFIRKA